MPHFRQDIKDTAKALHMPDEFLTRSINEGFSGGEKKKMEILQFSLLPAKCVIIDEIDSGFDIDALKLVAKQISKLRARRLRPFHHALQPHSAMDRGRPRPHHAQG